MQSVSTLPAPTNQVGVAVKFWFFIPNIYILILSEFSAILTDFSQFYLDSSPEFREYTSMEAMTAAFHITFIIILPPHSMLRH
jgi:hypothetical protein